MAADRRRAERGATLLEVLVALLILATAGGALASVLGAALRNEVGLARRERALLAADRLLAAYTLLTRAELDQRLGRRQVGEFLLDIQRPERGLYRLAVAERATPDVELLVTVVHRRVEASP